MLATESCFDVPATAFTATYLAEVVAVEEKSAIPRLQVRLLNVDGVTDQDGPVWARVATPFAGSNRGAFLVPDVGDEVLVIFLNGDPRLPIVVGGLWNGKATAPENLGGDGKRIDRWTIVGKAGTRIAIVEESGGSPTISFTTPGQVSGELTDAGGGKIELKAAGTTITVDSSGVTISTPAKFEVTASEIHLSAGSVSVDTASADFSQTVTCQTQIATSVTAQVYAVGAGNVW